MKKLLIIWFFVAIFCAISEVPFYPYGIYWFMVTIVLLVLIFIKAVKTGKYDKI